MRAAGAVLAVTALVQCSDSGGMECMYSSGNFSLEEKDPDPSLELGFTYDFETIIDRWTGSWAGRFPGSKTVKPFDFTLTAAPAWNDKLPPLWFEYDKCDPNQLAGECDRFARKAVDMIVDFDSTEDAFDYHSRGSAGAKGYHLNCKTPDALDDANLCGCMILSAELVDGETTEEEVVLLFHLTDDGQLYINLQEYGEEEWVKAQLSGT